MSTRFRAAMVMLLLPLGAVCLLGPGEAAPLAEAGRPPLREALTMTVEGLEINAAALLADNDSIVVVGGKYFGPNDRDRVIEEAAPAGAMVNLKTRVVRPFTNGHAAKIKSVARSADGRRIFTGTSHRDPSIRIWDIQAAKTLDPLPLAQREDEHCNYEVACFTGSSRIAITARGFVEVLDPARRQEKVQFTAEKLSGNQPDDLVISPDDKFLACHNVEEQVFIWDVQTRKLVYSPSMLPPGADFLSWSIHKLGFTKKGAQLLVARSGKEPEVPKGIPEDEVAPERRGLFSIDIDNRKVTPLGIGHQIDTDSFALHPSEQWLVTIGTSRPDKPKQKGNKEVAGELRIYDFQTRSLLYRLQFEDDFFPTWVSFTPDGKKLVATTPGDVLGLSKAAIKVWDFVPPARQ